MVRIKHAGQEFNLSYVPPLCCCNGFDHVVLHEDWCAPLKQLSTVR